MAGATASPHSVAVPLVHSLTSTQRTSQASHLSTAKLLLFAGVVLWEGDVVLLVVVVASLTEGERTAVAAAGSMLTEAVVPSAAEGEAGGIGRRCAPWFIAYKPN